MQPEQEDGSTMSSVEEAYGLKPRVIPKGDDTQPILLGEIQESDHDYDDQPDLTADDADYRIVEPLDPSNRRALMLSIVTALLVAVEVFIAVCWARLTHRGLLNPSQDWPAWVMMAVPLAFIGLSVYTINNIIGEQASNRTVRCRVDGMTVSERAIGRMMRQFDDTVEQIDLIQRQTVRPILYLEKLPYTILSVGWVLISVRWWLLGWLKIGVSEQMSGIWLVVSFVLLLIFSGVRTKRAPKPDTSKLRQFAAGAAQKTMDQVHSSKARKIGLSLGLLSLVLWGASIGDVVGEFIYTPLGLTVWLALMTFLAIQLARVFIARWERYYIVTNTSLIDVLVPPLYMWWRKREALLNTQFSKILQVRVDDAGATDDIFKYKDVVIIWAGGEHVLEDALKPERLAHLVSTRVGQSQQ